MNVGEIIDSQNISPKDSRNKIKKDILFRYDEEKMNNPKMKSEDVATKLGFSLSTINRYRRELGDIQRTRKKLTPEKKREVKIKTADTKMRNKMFDNEITYLRKQNLPLEEYEAQKLELIKKYSTKGLMSAANRVNEKTIKQETPETNVEQQVVKTVKSKKTAKGEAFESVSALTQDAALTRPKIDFDKVWNGTT